MTTVLEVKAASKRFVEVTALRGVDLAVRAGERVALLGHNGAGKTTLFRLILGYLDADEGAARICGHAPGDRTARARTAYLPENVSFAKNLTGAEVIGLYASLKRCAPNEGRDALERVGLADAARRRVGAYSKGMRQRLGLAVVSLGDPKLILLDEPTSGLDAQSRELFYEFFAVMAKNGAAVLFSSHTLNDIAGRTDRIAILKSGALVAEGAEDQLRAQAGLSLRITAMVDPARADNLAALFGGSHVDAGRVELRCLQTDKMAMLARIVAAGEAVRDVKVEEPALTDIYRYYTEGAGR